MNTDGLPTPRRYWSMLAIAIGIVMAVLDSSVANVALPTIASALHASAAASVWIVNAYQLTNVAALLALASLGERIGYRRVYVGGLAIFTLGSLACALSPTLTSLIIARIVQALGAAGIMAVNGALVRYTYPSALLGRGVGLNALVVSIAAALAPTIASGILAIAPWQWLFAVNVPIGLINLVLATRSLPPSEKRQVPVDWISAGLNAVLFALLFIGVDTLVRAGGARWIGLAEIVIAASAGAMLLRRTSRSTAPIIPIDLMKNPLFSLSVATSICSFTAYMLAFLAMPFFLETVMHRDQVQTGLLMTPWPVALGLAAAIAGRMADKLPAAILGTAGLSVLAIGLVALATLSPDAYPIGICWRMALCGLGFGFFQAPNNRTLLASAPRIRAGAAGGMLAVARLFGMTLGATLATVIFRIAPLHAEMFDLMTAASFALTAAAISLSRLAVPGRQLEKGLLF